MLRLVHPWVAVNSSLTLVGPLRLRYCPNVHEITGSSFDLLSADVVVILVGKVVGKVLEPERVRFLIVLEFCPYMSVMRIRVCICFCTYSCSTPNWLSYSADPCLLQSATQLESGTCRPFPSNLSYTPGPREPWQGFCHRYCSNVARCAQDMNSPLKYLP